MEDKRTLHYKLQEMCDCFATADPLKEMRGVKTESDKEEAALKWLALAILYGIDSHAKKISIQASDNGEISVRAKYRESELPSPGVEVGKRVIESIRQIVHIDEDEGKTPLAVGIRDGSIDVDVEVEREKGGEVVTIKFPEMRG